jgi:hypothetical protein
MELSALREAKQAVPFRAFRLCLADGRSFLIHHPDYIALPTTSRRIVLYGKDEKDCEIIDPLLVVSIRYGELPEG